MIGAFGAVAGLLALNTLPRNGARSGAAALGVAEAHARALDRSLTLIDIRRPDEWAMTGIGEGAHPIDMRRRDFIEALSATVGGDRGAPIALICARGVRSARLARRLAEAGFTQVIDVPEGMLGSASGPGWLARDLPVRPHDGRSG